MEKEKLRAVGYRRVSMREQIDGHSLDAQEKNIRDYAEHNDWELIEIYTDAGISAKKDRPPCGAHDGEIKTILHRIVFQAGRVGFEPTAELFPSTHLAGEPNRPLWHLPRCVHC